MISDVGNHPIRPVSLVVIGEVLWLAGKSKIDFHISTWMLIVMGWHGCCVVKFNLTEHPVLLHLVQLHFAEFNFCNCPIYATSHHHMTKFRPWNLGQVTGTLIAAARAEAKRSCRWSLRFVNSILHSSNCLMSQKRALPSSMWYWHNWY